MSHTKKDLTKSQVELSITVAPADYQKDLEAAAARLSERAAIHGFRPGKAPYDIVKQNLGEIKIMEEALQQIVETSFYKAVTAEKLSTIGMPEITIEKMAPGNDFVFKATVALMPSVKLADLTTIKVERKDKKVDEAEVNKVIEDLRKMQGKEVAKDGIATKDDKVVVSMNMSIDKVPVEGGQAPNHQVYLNEPHYIPGFAEQLIGVKKDENKKFSLKFPEEHYQKHLAGKEVDFDVTVKDIFSVEYPELTDEFATKLEQKSLADLRKVLGDNLTHEAEHKEEQRLEGEILEKVIAGSTFDEIPEVLIKAEKQKMFFELKHSLEQQGITLEDYLKDLKKTEEEIYADFTERANTRVKAALVSRQIALDNGIKVEEKEIEAEAEKIKQGYNNDPKVLEALKRPDVLDTLAATIQNRKVVELMKEKVCGKSTHDCSTHSHE